MFSMLAACGGDDGGPIDAPVEPPVASLPPSPVPAPTPVPPPPPPVPPPTLASASWRAAIAATGDTVAARGTAPAPGGGFYFIGSFQDGAPLNIGGSSVSSAGLEDIFVARVDAAGALIWLRRFGGTAGDFAFDVDSDAAGFAYVAGRAAGRVAFDATTIDAGDGDAVLFKLDPNGEVVWARQVAGRGGSAGNEVATDANGNSAMVGPSSGDLDLGNGITASGPVSGTDPFVAYYTADGSPRWARVLKGSDQGSSTTEAARGVAIDAAGRVVMTGPFTGTLAATPGALLLDTGSTANTDCYLVGFAASGSLDFARQFGGAGSDNCRGVGGDLAGGLRVAGTFEGAIFSGADQLQSAGGQDIFIVSFTASGTISWTRRIGGTGGEEGAETQLIGNDVFVFGNFVGSATLPGGASVTSAGLRDNILVRLDPDGALLSALTAGGTGDELAFALAVQPDATVAVVGTYNAPSVTFGAITLPATALSSFFAIARPGG